VGGRIDYMAGSRDRLSGSYFLRSSRVHKPFMSTPVPGFDGDVVARSHLFRVSYAHIFRANLSNETSVAFNRTPFSAEPATLQPGLSISLLRGERPLGQINVGGLPPLGNALTLPVDQRNTRIEVGDTLAYE